MNKKMRTPIAAILLTIITILDIFKLIYNWELYNVINTQNILVILRIAINVVLCIALFTKKQDNFLLIVLGSTALLEFVELIKHFSYPNLLLLELLSFLSYALLPILVLPFCEQTFVKSDLSKLKKLSSKLIFLPAILSIATTYFGYKGIQRLSLYLSVSLLSDLLRFAFFLILPIWTKKPYTKSDDDATNTQSNNDTDHTKKIFRRLMISIFVLAIGVILMFLDAGEITGINVGTCLKCWGKGVVENAYGIMVKCKNCSGGQLAYQNSSFGITGLVGALIAFVSGFSTAIHWNLLKK